MKWKAVITKTVFTMHVQGWKKEHFEAQTFSGFINSTEALKNFYIWNMIMFKQMKELTHTDHLVYFPPLNEGYWFKKQLIFFSFTYLWNSCMEFCHFISKETTKFSQNFFVPWIILQTHFRLYLKINSFKYFKTINVKHHMKFLKLRFF